MSAGGTYISTASVEVPQALQDGEKFIRWDDVSRMLFFTKKAGYRRLVWALIIFLISKKYNNH